MFVPGYLSSDEGRGTLEPPLNNRALPVTSVYTSSCSFVQNWLSFNYKHPKISPKIAWNYNTWQNSFLTRTPVDLHLDTRMMDWLRQLVSPPDQQCLAPDQVLPSRIKSIIPRAAGISPVSEISPQEQISPWIKSISPDISQVLKRSLSDLLARERADGRWGITMRWW